jgi:trans-2,3-dihydro-3-hydroxyanthranilate isomerase
MSRLAWVDVFAAEAMTGNPLAVVLDADAWTTERMQAFAAELGISETTFVLDARDGGDHRVRIFTPVRELPMAGHPIVGTAWVLRAAGQIGEHAVLETDAGALAVRVRGSVATMDQASPAAGPEVDGEEAARAAGVRLAGGAPPVRIWSTGVPQLMLPAELDSLESARPDHDALRQIGERDGWVGVSVYAVTGSRDARLLARVRHFAPLLGVPEDPVTGSAAGALGACLAAHGMSSGDDLELVVTQGAAGGRGGEVAVRVRSSAGVPSRVRVGGRVVPLFEGHVLDP